MNPSKPIDTRIGHVHSVRSHAYLIIQELYQVSLDVKVSGTIESCDLSYEVIETSWKRKRCSWSHAVTRVCDISCVSSRNFSGGNRMKVASRKLSSKKNGGSSFFLRKIFA